MRGVLIAGAAFFLLYFLAFPLRGPLVEWLRFTIAGRSDPGWVLQPWAWLTYPIVITDPVALLFGGYWFYMCGGVLERAWGSRNFAVLLASFTFITVLGFILAALIFDVAFRLAGLWLPTTALLVAWAAMDPEQEIRFWGILPLKMKMLAAISVALVYFYFGLSYGPLGPIIGIFALAGSAAAYIYVRKMPRLDVGFALSRPQRRPEPQSYLRIPPDDREKVRGFNPLRKRQEQEEIARLKKLLGEDDDDRPAALR